MKNILGQLWRLQEFDRKILVLRGGGLTIPDLKFKQDEVTRIRLQERKMRQELDALRLSKERAIGALEASRQRIMRTEFAAKEMGSSTEFQAAIKNIDQLKDFEKSLVLKKDGIDVDAEALNVRITEFQTRCATLERDIEGACVLKNAKDMKIEEAVREIEAQKDPIQNQVPPRFLALYQRIAGARGGVAVVEVIGKSCSACNMLLPAQFIIELSQPKTLEQCPSCKRILVGQILKEASP